MVADIWDLQESGWDIICNRGRQNQYVIGDRGLELAELKLIIDAVQAARFISPHRTEGILEKLTRIASPSDWEELCCRFTLAHEADHVLANRMGSSHAARFHRPHDTERIYDIRELQERLSIAEWQANTLAASLLMPRFLVRQELERHTAGKCLPVYGERVFRPREKAILSEMAREMGVSYTALVIRLDNLGALSHHPLSEYLSKELGLGGDGDAFLR